VTVFPLSARRRRGHIENMKARSLLAAALCAAALAEAEALTSRSVQIYSAGLCAALPLVAADGLPGYTVGLRGYRFLDPERTGGWYWYAFASNLAHRAGAVTIGDARPFGAGWRQEVSGGWGFDLGASLVTGARIEGTTITASGFIGVSPQVSLYLSVSDGFDIGLAFEPVFMLLPWGADYVAARDYLDLSLCIGVKSLIRTETLPWRSAPGAAE
jgi:hypothetical protein